MNPINNPFTKGCVHITRDEATFVEVISFVDPPIAIGHVNIFLDLGKNTSEEQNAKIMAMIFQVLTAKRMFMIAKRNDIYGKAYATWRMEPSVATVNPFHGKILENEVEIGLYMELDLSKMGTYSMKIDYDLASKYLEHLLIIFYGE